MNLAYHHVISIVLHFHYISRKAKYYLKIVWSGVLIFFENYIYICFKENTCNTAVFLFWKSNYNYQKNGATYNANYFFINSSYKIIRDYNKRLYKIKYYTLRYFVEFSAEKPLEPEKIWMKTNKIWVFFFR